MVSVSKREIIKAILGHGELPERMGITEDFSQNSRNGRTKLSLSLKLVKTEIGHIQSFCQMIDQ